MQFGNPGLIAYFQIAFWHQLTWPSFRTAEDEINHPCRDSGERKLNKNRLKNQIKMIYY